MTPKQAWTTVKASQIAASQLAVAKTSGTSTFNSEGTVPSTQPSTEPSTIKQLTLRNQYQELVVASRNITISNLQKDNCDLRRFLDASRARVRELEDKIASMADYNELRLKSLLGFAKGVETGVNKVGVVH